MISPLIESDAYVQFIKLSPESNVSPRDFMNLIPKNPKIEKKIKKMTAFFTFLRDYIKQAEIVFQLVETGNITASVYIHNIFERITWIYFTFLMDGVYLNYNPNTKNFEMDTKDTEIFNTINKIKTYLISSISQEFTKPEVVKLLKAHPLKLVSAPIVVPANPPQYINNYGTMGLYFNPPDAVPTYDSFLEEALWNANQKGKSKKRPALNLPTEESEDLND